MSMIFPGMDPYLEHPQHWTGVHSSLIVYLRDQLQPQLLPKYVASVEERVYVEGPERQIAPDVWVERTGFVAQRTSVGIAVADEPVIVQVQELEVHETYIQILDRSRDEKVVTVIEVVSPANKIAGAGRESYTAKQQQIISSDVHLIEIDLLRAGPHVVAVPQATARREGVYDYVVSVNRALGRRDRFELYLRSLRQLLPTIRVPLSGDDPDVTSDLQAAMNQTYEFGGYRYRIDYTKPCVPPLGRVDSEWAAELIKSAGLPQATSTPPPP